MPWRQLQDPMNPENKNAGNGGDMAKHTVYLTVLDFLLAHSPWSAEIRIRGPGARERHYVVAETGGVSGVADPANEKVVCIANIDAEGKGGPGLPSRANHKHVVHRAWIG